MMNAVKFRVTCERCGKRQPRATTAWTCAQWMSKHVVAHRPDAEAE